MVSSVKSYALVGIDAVEVDVQVDVSKGIPGISIVGLPDSAVKESRERVKTAIVNSGYPFPPRKILVNLAPADVRKEGTVYDLPVCLAVLAGIGIISADSLKGYIVAGEIDLEGNVRRVKGVLSASIFARKHGYKGIMIPAGNLEEALLVSGVRVIPVKNLFDAVAFLNGDRDIDLQNMLLHVGDAGDGDVDMADVSGQYQARRALEIAAAGRHNVLMVGPPGSGKTMLARRLTTILPPMTEEEIVETTMIHSVAGVLDGGIVKSRVFRAPHHTASDVALIGGGSSLKPGEVSLAHNGVLFLDELPEFKRSSLEALRQPLEDGKVTVSRASGAVTFPASFTLVAAMNPCPCGFYGFEGDAHECVCSFNQIRKYRMKVSGPVLDRIDVVVSVPAVKVGELGNVGEDSASIRVRVLKAHEVQKKRFKSYRKLRFNGQMGRREIKKFCSLTPDAEGLLERAIRAYGLSARSYDRILKVSRTIADIEGSDIIESQHVAEALSFKDHVFVS